MKHLGSAHDEQEPEALLATARQQLADSQQELDLGLDVAAARGPGPLQIASSRMACCRTR
jgi:hypothetical protein